VFLWNNSTKIIISDIDGTITRSDVLGQVLPIIGKDWSHKGVTKLYTNIKKNGYELLYLTARAIGQADQTRSYITGLSQDKEYFLPDGPVIMSPDRLIPSFKREVIHKKPQLFKIAALRNIRNLFTDD
jgi:phosphatidate phosphatase LPIN